MKQMKLSTIAATCSVLAMIGFALLGSPWFSPPQCPANTTTMPDGSSCAVGANIGGGLLLLYAITPLVFVSIALWLTVLTRWLRRELRS